jgi:NhaA family Na+:H+ antiporter
VSRSRESGALAAVLGPLERFLRLEAASGIVLLAAAVVALVWANSPWSESYGALWETPLSIAIGGLALEKSLLHWINDGLMAVFFFVVGLEIKRELVAGELRDPRRAALPLVCAIGGMLAPALFYVAINAGTPAARGWAIPAATDIAFAVGVLALLGSRAPLGLKVFLTALAILDDLGAVIVIALFYTSEIDAGALLAAGVALTAGVLLNRLGVRAPLPYAGVGAALWLATLKSGVHATVAGVLLAFTIPARAVLPAERFAKRVRELLARLERAPEERADVAHELAHSCTQAEAPLARIEHALAPFTTFVVMPVFALANAGLSLGGGALSLSNPIALGVALGLFVGKPLGITAAAWIAVRTGVAALPTGVSWQQIFGAGSLAGIGFTMSLFIGGLAFPGDADALAAAKLGVFSASLASGVLGFAWLSRVGESRPRPAVPSAT